MAKPIKITPVLEDKDAIKFLTAVEENRTKSVSVDKVQAIKNGAAKLNAVLKAS